MVWQKKKILITGADHFIGVHLAEKLIKLGGKVKALVRNDYQGSTGFLEKLPLHIKNNLQIVFGNITNSDIVDHVTKDINVIIHFGVLDAIPPNPINTRGYLEGTLIGIYNILYCAQKYKTQKIIHISTADIYGNTETTPVKESALLKALSPQTSCDIGAEKLVEGFYNFSDLPITTLRLFNAYGSMQSTMAIIPTIILQALKEPNILLGNMHAVRDFVYVDDVVNGIIKSAEADNLSGEVINIGSGKGISIGDLADKIVNIIGEEREILFDATRIRLKDHGIDKMIADITKAKNLLGWEPKTSLDDGLEETIEWFAERVTIN